MTSRPVPGWFREAKLGIVVHWGLYSIPAFAERGDGDFTAFTADLTAGKDTRGRIPYAEWYLNALRVPGSATALHHRATYGADFSYSDFRGPFDAAAMTVDFADWARCFACAGARYVVLVTRHLDGYPLWPTAVPNPHVPAHYRSRRDIVGGLTDAVRAAGLRMGLYYAGGLDWTFTTRPIRTMTDLMRRQSLGVDYARYATAQWMELIGAYRPSVLWNDMGWPAESNPEELFARYYDTVPDGVVNDRWTQVKLPSNRLVRELYLWCVALTLRAMSRLGRPLPTPAPAFPHDVRTYEYAIPDPAPASAWELTRGLGGSFGYNAQESVGDTLTGTQLIHLLVDVVAHGGNLLINVGPDGNGRIPDLQQRPLAELGAWLDTNGDAIYATSQWTRASTTTTTGEQVRLTHRDGTLYAIVLADRLPAHLTLRKLCPSPGSRIGMLNEPGDLPWTQTADGVRVAPPPQPPGGHAHVLTIKPV